MADRWTKCAPPSSGPAPGRYSQDLVRKLKYCRGLADIEKGGVGGHDDATVQSLALVEDDDTHDNNSTFEGLA